MISYCISMSILLGIIYFLSQYISKIPADDIKYLGLILSGFGVFLFIKQNYFKKEISADSKAISSGNLKIILAATMLMDSFDTMSVFVPLFADSNEASDIIVGVSFVVSFLAYGLSGLYISKLRVFKFLTLHRDKVIPIIMVLVGIYIFANTQGDVE